MSKMVLAACIALPVLLRGIPKSPDDAMRKEVREAWRRTAEAAIHALEAEEVVEADGQQDAAQAALAAELKARIMSEYRHQLEVYNDSAEAQALAPLVGEPPAVAASTVAVLGAALAKE